MEAVQPAQLPLKTALVLDPTSLRYRRDLDLQALAPGNYQLEVVIDGGTFKRKLTKRFKIAGPPLTIHYEQRNPSDNGQAAALILTLNTETDLIDPQSLFGYLLLRGPADQHSAIDLPPLTGPSITLELPIALPGGYRIQGRLLARTRTGESLAFAPEPRTFSYEFAPPEPAAEQDPAAGGKLNWIALGAYLLGGNALLGALLALTWWWLQRSKPGTNPTKMKQPRN